MSSWRHRHAAVAAAVALVIGLVAWSLGAKAVGGADSYGYVSQATAWRAGALVVHDPLFDREHPPFSRWALAPLGWRPDVDGWTQVPVYSPGYPLMLAAASAAGGARAAFAVVPCCAALLVLATYALGRALARPWSGVVAAVLVATSAAVLYQAMLPMTDIPSAALWTLVLAGCLDRRRVAVAAVGFAAALGILVRPNLVGIVAIAAAWLCVVDAQEYRGRLRAWRLPWFVPMPILAAVVNAMHNATLYGSPWRSGYGDLSSHYAWAKAASGAADYLRYLASSATPLAPVAVLVALLSPWLLERGPARRAAWLFAPVTALVVVTYVFYDVHDAWWYLRFVLPVFPIAALTSVLVLTSG